MLSTLMTLSDFFGRFLSQASHTHDAITEAAQLMKEAVDDIMVTLNEAASEVGMVGGMVDSIAEAMSKVSTEIQSPFHFVLGSRCALQQRLSVHLSNGHQLRGRKTMITGKMWQET